MPSTASRFVTYPPKKTVKLPTTAPTVDYTCTRTYYTAETVDWKTYTNTNHSYSFKYPKEAMIVINNHSDAPEDYNDDIAMPLPSQTKAISPFHLSVATSESFPEEVNYFNDGLKKAEHAGGEWVDTGNNQTITRLTYLNQPAINIRPIYKNENDNDTTTHIKFIRDDVLFDISLDMKNQILACQILSTLDFIEPKPTWRSQ